MEWIKFVVPLIAVAVWILANLARSQQRPPVRRPPLPGPGDKGEVAPPKSEGPVDQFLKEVARRRQEAAERRKAGPSDVTPLEREPAKAETPPARFPMPADPPIPVARRAPAPPRVRERLPKSTSTDRPRALPEVRPVRARAVVLEVATAVPASPPPPSPAAESAPSPSTMLKPAARSAAAQVLAMLGDKVTLPACFLLHEIFQPPLSRRHGHFPRARG
jgi:hypothetical protein